MTERLRVGVVGSGNIATIAQLPTLSARDDVDLTALATHQENPELVQRRWGFRSVHRDLRPLLETAEVDVVFVLTPRMVHAENVEDALRAGKDVFCEKPLATTADEAQRLADLADEMGRLLMVGLNRRFAPVYRQAHEAFGERPPQICVAQKNRPGSEYRATFENAIHMVDLLRWFCGGDPVSINAVAQGSDPWAEEGLSALIQFSTGSTGVLVAARQAGRWSETLQAYGSLTTAEVTAPDSVAITREGVTRVREMSPESFGWATATETMGFAGAVRHFLECVRERRQPETNGQVAAATQRLLEGILSAAGLPTEELPGRGWTSHAAASSEKP